MAIERANPLPIGRYWVDVPEASKEAFRAWLERNKIGVRVLTTEEGETDWYLFETLSPYTRWEGPGLPTIASGGVESKDDTGTRRTEDEIREDMIDDVKDIGSGLESFGKAAFFLGAGYALYRIFRR